MKKHFKKLNLNKKTISNLNSSEMSRLIGGSRYCSYFAHCGGSETCHTKKGNTCPGHKTCYTC